MESLFFFTYAYAPSEPILIQILVSFLIFRQPTGASAGVFELRPELRAEFNPFFYHYSRSQKSKVNSTLLWRTLDSIWVVY